MIYCNVYRAYVTLEKLLVTSTLDMFLYILSTTYVSTFHLFIVLFYLALLVLVYLGTICFYNLYIFLPTGSHTLLLFINFRLPP